MSMPCLTSSCPLYSDFFGMDGLGCYNMQSYPFTSPIFSTMSFKIDNEPSFEGTGRREA
jgi:hypothetical protein